MVAQSVQLYSFNTGFQLLSKVIATSGRITKEFGNNTVFPKVVQYIASQQCVGVVEM
jgi:hypothetical protein